MKQDALIAITGAAGFIGSCLVEKLNQLGYDNLLLIDDFDVEEKQANWNDKQFTLKVDRDEFDLWTQQEDATTIEYFFHLGARTDTTETDEEIFDRLNLNYSKFVWNYCVAHQCPLVYASSAATYGGGEMGYKEEAEIISKLQPLNAYGRSKNDFDKWAFEQKEQPPFWAGMKFFNVYGPNEYHKERMASVILHGFNQISQNGKMKLFRSHRKDYKDGQQLRDFIYVKDVIAITVWLMEQQPEPGLYNVGTGKARTFNDLARSLFLSLGLQPSIKFIDMPKDIRDKYQYFTEADMGKLKAAGYDQPFYSLEEGVADYVIRYLEDHRYF